MICERCGIEYFNDYRKYPKGKSKYCSFVCSKKRVLSEETKEKIALKLKKNDDCKCIICNKKISHKNNQKYCKDCKPKIIISSYERVKDFRKRMKEKALEYKGGKCIICGYNKCNRSLEFHHINPSEKEFNISKSLNTKWEFIKEELDKCILVCSNCHNEIHEGLVEPTIK